MYPTASFLFLVIVIFTINHLPTYFCQVDSPQYVACAGRFRCANFTDPGYPFWGGDRAAHCGHPAFRLSCQGDVPLITLQSKPYRVLGIDTRSLLITVARQDLWNNTCPSTIYNTDFDYSVFRHPSGDQNLTLSYGCPTVPGQQTLYEFDCTVNETSSDNYFITQAALVAPNPAWATCSDSLSVPINQTSAQLLTLPTSSENELKEVLKVGFGLIWEANDSSCNECARSGGRCGYNSSTSSFACYCFHRPYPSKCNVTESDFAGSSKLGNFGVGLLLGTLAAGLLITAVLLYCFWSKCLSSKYMLFSKTGRKNYKKVEAFLKLHGNLAPKRFRYQDIKKMTQSFKCKLGQGGYGGVYKGKLPDNRAVAVKILNKSKSDGEEFLNEVASISRTNHVNIVSLLGFCFEGPKRALVYEFMPNGSLEKFISHGKSSTVQQLGWQTVKKIAVGIAQGLEYLHRGCSTRILHFDIKPHNILLDEEFSPKISDFGLAKLCLGKESIISLQDMRGTPGYIAPEVFSRMFGGVSHKSDVYSYGMMILELVGGKNNVNEEVNNFSSEKYFPDWIYDHLELNADQTGHDDISNDIENGSTRKMMIVGLWCIQTHPSNRPSMKRVLEMLEQNLESLQIPPRPFLDPTEEPLETCSTT